VEKRFRQMVKELATHDHLPDYKLRYDDVGDMVEFRNRGSMFVARGGSWLGYLCAGGRVA